MEIRKGVPAHQGVTLALEQDEGGLIGTVILSRANQLSQVFRGQCAEGIRRAEQASLESGFEGYYDITGLNELTSISAKGLGGVLPEINRQTSSLQSKAGFRWGFNPNWSPQELAAMPSAQAQLSRLIELRNALTKRLAI